MRVFPQITLNHLDDLSLTVLLVSSRLSAEFSLLWRISRDASNLRVVVHLSRTTSSSKIMDVYSDSGNVIVIIARSL